MKIRIGLREGDFMFLFSLIVQCLVMLAISDRSVEPDLIYFPEIGYLLYHCWLPHEIASKSFRTSRILIPRESYRTCRIFDPFSVHILPRYETQLICPL